VSPVPRPTAFVLGGGGRYGAAQVGMLRALVEAGIGADVVVGTSIGAINGAFHCADPTVAVVERMERLWRDVASGEGLDGSLRARVRHFVGDRASVQDRRPLADLLRSQLPVERFEELAVPFQCVAASIERATEHWFTAGPLVPALMASAAVPGIFPPMELDGEHFYDGGLVDSIPVARAIALGMGEIYVLQVGRVEDPLRPPTRLREAAVVAFEIARRHRFTTVMANLPADVTVHVLPTGSPVRYDDRAQLRWRDLSDANRRRDQAYQAAAVYLAERP